MNQNISLIRSLTSWKFKLYLLSNLPMGFITGLRIEDVSNEACTTSVPFNWLTKNPFRSMYFAVQSMAAELSTATHCLLATRQSQSSVAFIITDCQAKFIKKATSKVHFKCDNGSLAYQAVEECLKTDEAVAKTFKTTGTQMDGSIVSEFEFTWSFKKRN